MTQIRQISMLLVFVPLPFARMTLNLILVRTPVFTLTKIICTTDNFLRGGEGLK